MPTYVGIEKMHPNLQAIQDRHERMVAQAKVPASIEAAKDQFELTAWLRALPEGSPLLMKTPASPASSSMERGTPSPSST